MVKHLLLFVVYNRLLRIEIYWTSLCVHTVYIVHWSIRQCSYMYTVYGPIIFFTYNITTILHKTVVSSHCEPTTEQNSDNSYNLSISMSTGYCPQVQCVCLSNQHCSCFYLNGPNHFLQVNVLYTIFLIFFFLVF